MALLNLNEAGSRCPGRQFVFLGCLAESYPSAPRPAPHQYDLAEPTAPCQMYQKVSDLLMHIHMCICSCYDQRLVQRLSILQKVEGRTGLIGVHQLHRNLHGDFSGRREVPSASRTFFADGETAPLEAFGDEQNAHINSTVSPFISPVH